MKLWGAVHGIASVLEGNIKVQPSWNLIADISSLKDGESVGIEYPRQLCKGYEITGYAIEVDDGKLDLTDFNYYWSKILEAAKKRNLKVSFLDSLALIRQAVSKQVQSTKKYCEGLALEFSDEPGAKERRRELKRASYADGVEGMYIHDIMREVHILNAIKKTKPALAVVGKGHGDFFFADRTHLGKRGIIFDKYSRENAFHTPALDESKIGAPAFAYVDRIGISRDGIDGFMPRRDSLQRRYNAVKTGRIMAWKPDFIGTWDMEIPASGLFEVYIRRRRADGSVDGVIEDCIGGARFSGVISGNNVSFEKAYLDSARWTGGAPGVIRYEGTLGADGVYRGRFGGLYVDMKMNNDPEFEMRPFAR